jgi:hypothetical protein
MTAGWGISVVAAGQFFRQNLLLYLLPVIPPPTPFIRARAWFQLILRWLNHDFTTFG